MPKCRPNVGDTQIPSDMGTPFLSCLIYLFVIVSLIHGCRMGIRQKGKANLQKLK